MSKYADLVLQSNCVFTAVGEEPFAGFVAVAGSKILCVDHGAPDGAILGPNTKVLDIYETCRRDAQGRVINRHAITDLPLLIDNIPESVYHAVGGYFPEGGEPFNKQNMLTVTELLTAWTRGGACNLSCEDSLGTLEPGKKADIAALSGNLFTTPVENSRNLKVDLTLLNGSVVHNAL